MSYGLIDDRGWFECIFYYGAILWCPPSRANVRAPHCRVLQYFHDSLIVGCRSDRSLNMDKWVVAYGNKEDLILNAIVGFPTLMIFSSCGCLLEFQS